MTAESDSRQREVETQNAAACPVVQTIDRVGTPWRLNVIHALADGEMRFNELKRATEARSKTLSDVLDELTDSDIVERRVEAASPVAVHYALTQKGEELVDALGALDDWAQKWDAEVPDGPNPRLADD